MRRLWESGATTKSTLFIRKILTFYEVKRCQDVTLCNTENESNTFGFVSIESIFHLRVLEKCRSTLIPLAILRLNMHGGRRWKLDAGFDGGVGHIKEKRWVTRLSNGWPLHTGRLPRGDICVLAYSIRGEWMEEREWPSKFNFREMRKVSTWEKYRHVNEAIGTFQRGRKTASTHTFSWPHTDIMNSEKKVLESEIQDTGRNILELKKEKEEDRVRHHPLVGDSL